MGLKFYDYDALQPQISPRPNQSPKTFQPVVYGEFENEKKKGKTFEFRIIEQNWCKTLSIQEVN